MIERLDLLEETLPIGCCLSRESPSWHVDSFPLPLERPPTVDHRRNGSRRTTGFGSWTLLIGSQQQDSFGLRTLDSQIRQQGSNGGGCLTIRCFPPQPVAGISSIAFVETYPSAESVLEHLRHVRCNLRHSDPLLVGWHFRIASDPDVVSRPLDPDSAVRIDDSRKVGECGIFHIANYTTPGGDVSNGGA